MCEGFSGIGCGATVPAGDVPELCGEGWHYHNHEQIN